jgi:peptidoglycan/LPS O-acetylase OafA/YrhL
VSNLESFVLENGLFEIVENILYVIGTIFAAILIALSISAYRNTHLRKLIYAIIAFLLFGIFLFYEYLEHSISFDNPFTDIVLPSMALSILVLFFLAIINKR